MAKKHLKQCKSCFHSGLCSVESLRKIYKGKLKLTPCKEYKPTADVVEVVRCEKCRFACFQYNTDKYPFGVYACKKQPTGRAYKKVKGSHFCSYGERKESV